MLATILMWGAIAIVAILLLTNLSAANSIKALLRLIAAAASFVLALLLSGPTVAGFDTQLIDALAAARPEIADAIVAMPSLYPFLLGLLRPLVFLALYFIFVILLRIVLFIVGACFPKRYKNGGIPLISGVFGLLRGCILVVVLMTPILGYASIGNEAITAYVTESEAGTAEDAAVEKLIVLQEQLEAVESNALLQKISTVTDKVFAELVTTELSEEVASPTEELPIFAKLVYHVRWLVNKPLAEFGAGETAALQNISDLFGESVFLPTVSSEVLSAMTTKWANGESFLNLEKPELTGAFATLSDSLFDVLASSTKETVTPDIATVADLMTLMVEYEILSAEGDDVFAKLTATDPQTGKTFVSEAILLLENNPHMAPLRQGITTLVMEAVGGELGTPAELRENYGDMVDDMVDVLATVEGETNEEKIANLTPVIKDGLAENGLEVPESVVDEASRLILDELEANGITLSELTADDIFDILDSFTAANGAN